MTSSLIGDGSSHCLGRSSGRPFVYGPSLACPHRVSQVSMGTMVCFLANASINPQTGSGNLAAGEWSEDYQIGLGPCLLCQAGFFFAGDRGRARTCNPQLRRLMLSLLSDTPRLNPVLSTTSELRNC